MKSLMVKLKHSQMFESLMSKRKKEKEKTVPQSTVIDSLQVCQLNKMILIAHLHHVIAKRKMGIGTWKYNAFNWLKKGT